MQNQQSNWTQTLFSALILQVYS